MTLDLTKVPDYMKDPNAVLKDDNEWVNGSPPDYDLVNNLYDKEKSVDHVAGSMEALVSNLIKNWEREASHKKVITDCRTMDLEKFRFATNGIWISAEKLGQIGNYNALIGDNEYYAASRVSSSHESHQIFRTALSSGFAWECQEVLSPPPKLAFKWRHWGEVTGEMKCPMRNGTDLILKPNPDHPKKVEIFGLSIIELNEDYKVTSMETFWNPDQLFQQIVN